MKVKEYTKNNKAVYIIKTIKEDAWRVETVEYDVNKIDKKIIPDIIRDMFIELNKTKKLLNKYYLEVGTTRGVVKSLPKRHRRKFQGIGWIDFNLELD